MTREEEMFKAQAEICKQHRVLCTELGQYAIQLGFEYADAHPQDWIDFKQRRPEDGQNVFVLVEGFPLVIPTVYHDDGNDKKHSLNNVEITSEEVRCEVETGNDVILYWLPAPVTPKELQI